MEVKIIDIKIDKDALSTRRRVRKSLGDITKLAESIKTHGLMHPIVVTPLTNDDRYKWILVAGERRVRAYIINGEASIECKVFKDLDNVDQKICELEENVVRENLSWMEECEALRQLDELQKSKHGRAQPGGTEGWKLGDTADAVGMAKSTLADDIKLARDLKDNPELVKRVVKLPKTAAKKIVRQELDAKKLSLQVRRGEIKIATNLLLGDACELIDTLKDESVHLLITDPPFGVKDIVNVAAMGTMTYNTISSTNVATEDVMRKVYKILLPKVFNKLFPGSHIYVFLAMGWYSELISMLRKTGFIVDDLPLIWAKGRPSMIAKDIHYTSSYEAILFGHKPPTTRYLRKPISNVLDIPTIAPQKRIHPLQKPFDLLKILIENSSHVGELVLDCFAGSASTLIAAEKLKRSSIGFEIDEANYLRAQEFMQKG